METLLLENISPHINATLFGYGSVEELFEAELRVKHDDIDTTFSSLKI